MGSLKPLFVAKTPSVFGVPEALLSIEEKSLQGRQLTGHFTGHFTGALAWHELRGMNLWHRHFNKSTIGAKIITLHNFIVSN